MESITPNDPRVTFRQPGRAGRGECNRLVTSADIAEHNTVQANRMTDPTLERMSIGFNIFAVAAFVWASVDYNRFIKFWMLRPAPYTQRVKVIFRLFFLACVIGGVWQLADTIASFRKPAMFYLSALPFTIAWLVVFFLMLRAVEWMNVKWRARQTRERQQ
jgi:hypothetical protein